MVMMITFFYSTVKCRASTKILNLTRLLIELFDRRSMEHKNSVGSDLNRIWLQSGAYPEIFLGRGFKFFVWKGKFRGFWVFFLKNPSKLKKFPEKGRRGGGSLTPKTPSWIRLWLQLKVKSGKNQTQISQ